MVPPALSNRSCMTHANTLVTKLFYLYIYKPLCVFYKAYKGNWRITSGKYRIFPGLKYCGKCDTPATEAFEKNMHKSRSSMTTLVWLILTREKSIPESSIQYWIFKKSEQLCKGYYIVLPEENPFITIIKKLPAI